MKAVLQRVSRAQVRMSGKVVGEIGPGLLILLGVAVGDTPKDADFLLDKIINLRIFEDPGGKMNLSLLDTKGELMVVSQFTLYADCRKGRRPSFTGAAPPEAARELYNYFVARARTHVSKTVEGVFRAMMELDFVNWGPVTIILDSR